MALDCAASMNRIGDNLICTGSNERLVSAFVAAGVEFLVVGGLAVSWYCTQRSADDMDLLLRPSKDNSEKAVQALLGLGLSGISVDAFAKLGVQAPIKQSFYADLITPPRGGAAYESVAAHAVPGKLFGYPISIPSLAALMELKARAAKEEPDKLKHAEDLALLKKAQSNITMESDT